jgi:photosystem II stability/assembly factor-like uncharacterized protein
MHKHKKDSAINFAEPGGAPSRRSFLKCLAIGGLIAMAAPAVQAFESPLAEAAMPSDRLATSPMLAVARAGSRLIAAGLRGSIIVSEDQGQSWTQAQVPVSVDLVAISFPSERNGWAVGHGGVVLHSADGGMTWEKQLDGHQASKLAIDYYSGNQAQISGAGDFLAKERNLVADNETQPFLGVFFSDEQHGYVVGTFNRIFATDDGGKHWVPQMHLADNPQEWHFYNISGAQGQLYITGEQGQVWRHDPQSGRFVSANTPYKGTLFGVATMDDGQLFVWGMRGSLFRSSDQGQNWERTSLPFDSNLTQLLYLGGNNLLVVGQRGEIARSKDGGHTFQALQPGNPMPYYGATLMDKSHLALAGALGVRIEAI